MELGELYRRLADFGIDESEARLYFTMSQSGPARAADLAITAGIHRTEVYRLAESLVKKGFIEKTLERPVRFVPVPLSDVIEQRTDKARIQLDSLKENGTKLITEWPAKARSWGTGASRFTVHQGTSQIRGLIDRMIEHAQEEITVVMNRHGLSKFGSAAFLSALARKARAGIQIRILTRIDPANVAELRSLAAMCDVRHVDLSGYHQMFIIDSKEIALFVGGGKQAAMRQQEETVLWLNAPEFVLAQKALVDRVWPTGVRHADMSQSLAKGLPIPKMEVIRGRWVMMSILKQMLYDADEILIHTTASQFDAWYQRGLAKVIRQRRQAGATIRIMISDGQPAIALHKSQERLAPLGTPFTLVSDFRGPTLMLRHGSEGEAHVADDWALYTTLPDVGLWAWSLLAANWEGDHVRIEA